MLRGLDASAVQGALPFKQLVAQGLRFCILKGQQGNDGFDPWFWRNLQGCVDHGLVPGMYFFTYPLPHLDPKKQAQLFFERSKGFGARAGELPPFLDLEWPEVVPSKPGKKGWKEWGCSPAQLADWMRDCCAEVHRLWGVRPILYTYPWWWACVRDGAPAYGFAKGGDVSWAADYPLWMADYPTRVGWPAEHQAPKIPAPWTRWLFWQFDGNNGMVLPNGVDSDFCVFNGGEEDLKALADHAPKHFATELAFRTVTNRDEMIDELVKQTKVSIVDRLLRPFGLT